MLNASADKDAVDGGLFGVKGVMSVKLEVGSEIRNGVVVALAAKMTNVIGIPMLVKPVVLRVVVVWHG